MDKEKREELIAVQLGKMGLSSTAEINAWVDSARKGNYWINGLKEAAEMILSWKEKPLLLVTDYDVDGITSMAIMYEALRRLGFKKVKLRIPYRKTEGYGLSEKIVDEITEKECLIVTCDNGIAALDAVRKAKQRGFYVIVTDHHKPAMKDGKKVFPDADLIIDPSAVEGSARFDGYCGAGLAYRLACAMLPEDRDFQRIAMGFAAIAVKADSVPIAEENYYIAHYGMEHLTRRMTTQGLLALMDLSYVRKVSSMNIDFSIAPAINAPGRLEDKGSYRSVELLLTKDYEKARERATRLIELNAERKRMTKDACQAAEEALKESGYKDGDPIVLYLQGIDEGVIGIVAGRLTESHHAASLVFTDAEGVPFLKGSGRSVEGIDLKGCLDKFGHLFVKYGGHPGAAGMTIKKEDFGALEKAAKETIPSAGEPEKEEPDAVITDAMMKDATLLYETFEPFGEKNPRPFLKVTGFRMIPKNGNLKEIFRGGTVKVRSFHSEAIGFGMEERMKDIEKPVMLTLYGHLSPKYIVDSGSLVLIPQFEFVDFEIEKEEDKETPLAKRLRGIGSR